MQVARGVTRTVLLVGRTAYKFPTLRSWKLFLCGLLANMQERELSGVWPELCPVRWGLPGGFMVAMVRAQPVDDAEWPALFDTVPPHVATLAETKPQNYGWLNGRLVAVDYAGCP